MNKPTFAISSPYDTYSGYGARSRDIIKAIINTGKYDVKLLPQKWGGTSWDFCNDHPEWEFLHNYRLEGNLSTKPDIWMQITIPNEFQAMGKYNIGVTAGIEATLCKPEWIVGCNKMDINWVSSKFSQEVLQKVSYEQRNKQTNLVEKVFKVEKPIEVVFEGVNLDIYKPLKANEVTSINLDTIKEPFCYLFVGHWMQGEIGHDRKNVGVLVKSFYETFKNKKLKPALILKASTGVNSYMSRDEILDKIKEIRSTINSSNLPNIYVLNGSFSDKEMNELYNHPKIKAMVSLTKGEGFGRPLLEFSLTGKPIIASGWSGHTDFLNSLYTTLIGGELENVHSSVANNWLIKEAKWFKPNIVEFNQTLKDHYKKPKTYNEKAKQQKHFSKTKFSYNEMEKLVNKLLEKNVPEFSKQVELKLPKMNLPQLQKIK